MFFLRTLLLSSFLLTVFSGVGLTDTINFNNNCDGQIPTNQGYKWHGSCPDPHYGETNWVGNVIPGPTDDAFIDASYGPIVVNGTWPITTVMSIDAMGGLTLDYSSYGLKVTAGTSTIGNLHLSNNADIYADFGAIVVLSGSTQMRAYVHGPGTFSSYGTLNLNSCRLRNGAQLENFSTATLSSGYMNLGDDDTEFFNSGTLTMSNGTYISGSGCRMSNDGALNFTGSLATPSYIDPNFTHTGELNIQSGQLALRGTSVLFESGSITVAEDAILEHYCPFGGPYEHGYNGLGSINGAGLVVVYDEFTVNNELAFNVGSGDPATGTGGYRLATTLHMAANASNSGRFRFLHGELAGGRLIEFTNQEAGWAYTTHNGGATIGVNFTNNGRFQLGGGGLTIEDATFSNFLGTFKVLAGNIEGIDSGWFVNRGLFLMEATDASTTCNVSAQFTNSANEGAVKAIRGHLVFSGSLSNLETPPMLESGTWIASAPATIEFPSEVTKLRYAAHIEGPKECFPNVNLVAVEFGSGLGVEDEWSELGDLLISDSEVEIQGGSELDVAGTYSNVNGSRTTIADDGQLTAGQVENGADPDTVSSVVPELCGITVLTRGSGKGGRGPAIIATPLLNNYARIVPGGHDDVGTMHLVGDLIQHATGELKIDLEGTIPGDQHDQMTIDGGATLAGTLTVSLLDGFEPAVGQQFTVLTTTGLVSGTFDTIATEPGIAFVPLYNPDSVILEVGSVTGVSSESIAVPDGLSLSAPVPNPGNPGVDLIITSTPNSEVNVDVYDLRGRRVLSQAIRLGSDGRTTFHIDGHDQGGQSLPTGVYQIAVRNASDRVTQRFTLVK